MSNSLPLKIKHSGKTYDVHVELDAPGSAFKEKVCQLTGVDPTKVKIPVKGGMLKDDADMKKLGLKPGQMLMVIGAAGGPPQAPSQAIVFMEDMTDQQLAEAVKYPTGLVNLGNTCYLNSTIQVLRTIPQLQSSLNEFRESTVASQPDVALTASLRDLFRDMSKTSEGFPPLLFLQLLRQWAPQFAERSRSGQGFAQQDAQEAWASVLQAMKPHLGHGHFVDRYLTGEFVKTLKSAEAPDEEPTVTTERFLELKCNISASTNYMINGVTEGLDQDIEKTSPSLGRSAVYHEQSRISRLPSYLTVNLVRFYWRREISKKAKIMRRVHFPFDLDLFDLLTPELKSKVRPVNEKLKEFDKDRRERAKVRKRAKWVKQKEEDEARAAGEASSSSRRTDGPIAIDGEEAKDPEEVELPKDTVKDGEIVDEDVKRKEEVEVLKSLLDEEIVKDVGANATGMYELQGIVTHKGASADGGHYIAFSRVTDGKIDEDPDKQKWYRFDDEKVTEVGRDKITALEGGGEDHSAYVLLYASKQLE